jgi:dihydrofolate synthase / folylpolyglutamate synthase
MSDAYEKALEYLYGFVNFEHRRTDQYSAENISLERPARLMEALGNPQDHYPSVHIAGTKGKGSVAAMMAACLRAAGLSVGLYTSPHLTDFRDRIRVLTPDDADGRIGREQLVAIVERLKPVVAQVPGLTWFELVTAIGFCHFDSQAVDVAVVEVGLGGRLDATNVLAPLVSVITSLSLDHTALLGSTLEEIAEEKGGIIKPNTPVISAPQHAVALERLVQIARARQAQLTVAGREWRYRRLAEPASGPAGATRRRQALEVVAAPASPLVAPGTAFTLALDGRHQVENAVVAIAALDAIHHGFPALDSEAVHRGLAEVSWPGRLQLMAQGPDRPDLLVDCAHNVDSAHKLAQALLEDYRYERLWLVLGVTADKDVEGLLQALLPLADSAILTASSHPRAARPEELGLLAHELGFASRTSPDVRDAVTQAWREAGPTDLICVTGSIFVVGDLLNQWDRLQSHFGGLETKAISPSTAD